MGGDIVLSTSLGLVGFIFAFTNIKFYLTTLSVLVVFSILNYWMRINIKEFLKSYFLVYFIIFFTAIIIIFYLTYGIETSRDLALLSSLEAKELSPQEYEAYNYFGFLTCITMFFLQSHLLYFLVYYKLIYLNAIAQEKNAKN